ncbi:hypothetical protein [Novipirellula artificiosorum]|uniref:Uncharacterized protein n=1 Tax=Novipirellula artificiosorum TaxID=2528016 RepID=A0A5C6DLD9_9BACT|nr:hypothetical protein [Novipirellula artificiosorum]TWU37422.1 hypothetical protein Poly41_35530 [Novipirellula artificiosorum]
MTIELELSPDVQKSLEQKAREKGVDVKTFVENLVQAAAVSPEQGAKLRGEALEEAFKELTHGLPPLGNDVDDSRESIYAGRGE